MSEKPFIPSARQMYEETILKYDEDCVNDIVRELVNNIKAYTMDGHTSFRMTDSYSNADAPRHIKDKYDDKNLDEAVRRLKVNGYVARYVKDMYSKSSTNIHFDVSWGHFEEGY